MQGRWKMGFTDLTGFSPFQVCLLQTCYKWHSCGADVTGVRLACAGLEGRAGARCEAMEAKAGTAQSPVFAAAKSRPKHSSDT